MRPTFHRFTLSFAASIVAGALLAGAPAGVAPARADEAPSTMLVIDGSGSMWGRFESDKRAKIDVIRDALKTPIAAAGASRIGFTSFGHRRRADCSDVEVIAEPTAERDGVLYALEKLNPRGKGPLVGGLKAAAAALGTARPASIVVIGDGADNCQQDACAFAAEFAKSTPGVAIHMIAIGVDAADQQRLQCLAKATGGTFHDVADSIGLVAAVDQVSKLAMLPAASAPTANAGRAGEPPAPAAVPAGASIRVAATLAEGGAPLNLPMHWRLYKSGEKQATIGESDGTDFSARLEPGTYDLEVDVGGITRRQSVTIEAGKTLSTAIALNAARLKAGLKSAKDSATAANQQALIAITGTGSGKDGATPAWLAQTRQTEVILPPGSYKVALTLGQIRQEKAIDLSAGSDAAVEFDLGSGELQVSAAASDGGTPINDVIFAVSEDDPDSPDGKRDVARSRSPNATFTLPAGTYYITARSGSAEVRQRIAVGAGDAVKQTLILPLVPVSIATTIAGQPAGTESNLVYRLYAIEGDTARPILRSLQPLLDLDLMPGKYRIAAHLDANHLKAVQDFTLEAGKKTDVTVKIDAAEVSLKGPGAAGERFWEIIDAQGKTVWHTAQSEPKALLSPGKYVVRLEGRDAALEAAFEIRSGERQTLRLGNN